MIRRAKFYTNIHLKLVLTRTSNSQVKHISFRFGTATVCKATFSSLSIYTKSLYFYRNRWLFKPFFGVSCSVRHSNTKPSNLPSLPSLSINFRACADVLEATEHALPDVVNFTICGCQCYQSPPVSPTTWPKETEGSGERRMENWLADEHAQTIVPGFSPWRCVTGERVQNWTNIIVTWPCRLEWLSRVPTYDHHEETPYRSRYMYSPVDINWYLLSLASHEDVTIGSLCPLSL